MKMMRALQHKSARFPRRLPLLVVAAGAVALAAALLLAVNRTAAQGSPLHPTFPLLDANGENVLETGNPVSTMETCGACHAVDFIAKHNAHEGVLTGALNAPAGEAVMINPDTGLLTPLDEAAASVEMNCFLCHSTAPDNTARLAALEAGQFEWANSATLLGTGIVQQAGDGYTWNAEAFAEDGTLLAEYVGIQDPAVQNCAQCHGVATTDATTPLVLDTCGTEQRMTITTGQIFAPQRMSQSGLNLTGKDELTRSWDVHAERIVGCTDCHYSLNNPAYAARPDGSTPEHLVFDPRRLDPGEYLAQPLHEFARSGGDTVTGDSCASCHDAESTHGWLPYADRHMETVACESCHVPRLEAPARETIDWTVLTAIGAPETVCRGETKESGRTLITGYDPVLLPREDGSGVIAPYNLITTWYWVDGATGEPVALKDLQPAYFKGENYHPDVLAALDANGDGALDEAELSINSEAAEAAIAARLEAIGVYDPRIESTVEAYPINHGVTHGEYAVRECSACHGDDSRLAAPIILTGSTPPGGVIPTLGDSLSGSGEIVDPGTGALVFQPQTGQMGSGMYVFGFSRAKIVDWIGVVFFLGTLLGVTAHGGLRFFAARHRAAHAPELREVYMYTVYERFWHWLQTAVILILIFTGLIIHKPDMFGMFSFRWVVLVHNVMAGVLIANAALAFFYHIASGQIKQFLPQPRGFFNDAIVQAKFYLRGIFEGAEHPFEKTPQRKMNPLQQVTYLAILNVLLPAQIITGALMWGAQRWPEAASALGGLPVLAPIHSLVAWLFASFIVAHVYLTTTGHEPLAAIKGMILGWDEVEAPGGAPAEAAPRSASK